MLSVDGHAARDHADEAHDAAILFLVDQRRNFGVLRGRLEKHAREVPAIRVEPGIGAIGRLEHALDAGPRPAGRRRRRMDGWGTRWKVEKWQVESRKSGAENAASRFRERGCRVTRGECCAMELRAWPVRVDVRVYRGALADRPEVLDALRSLQEVKFDGALRGRRAPSRRRA